MTRHLYGGTADYVITLGDADAATLRPGIEVTCWNAAMGGTQYTDLIAVDGELPVESLTTDETGAVPEFWGPPGVATLYLDSEEGPRRRATPTDAASAAAGVTEALITHEAAVNPHGTASYHLVDSPALTIAEMLTQDTWAPAHRGSGGEYPEHTLAGYAAMLAAGATDIEVSVVMTADGVLVAHHDSTLDRMTNATGLVASWSYAQLRDTVRVQAQDFLGAGVQDQPLPTLREVMDLLHGKCRVWLEAKVNAAVPVMRDWMLRHYPSCQRSVLWKAHYNQGGLANRHAEGWYVWAYVDAGTTDEQLDGIDHAVDMWGVPTAMSDARIAEIIARGKPVTMWEIHRFVDLARCDDVDGEGLVIQGRMSSRWHYLYGNLPDLATDHFDRRVSYPGTLGIAGYSPPNALRYDEDGGAYLDNVANRAVVMGRYRPASGTSHVIRWRMKWNTLPGSTLHSGIAFCRSVDDPYQFGTTNNSYGERGSPGGYHIVMRANGNMGLFSHVRGSTSGTVLGGGEIATPTPVAGEWLEFETVVSPTQVVHRRLDGVAAPYTITSSSTLYRGRYWHLSGGSSTTTPTWKFEIDPE
jgi:hypothetical protein